MTRDEAYALHRELEQLAASGPGGLSDEIRHQLRRIQFAFNFNFGPNLANPYLREKVWKACHWLEIWRSPRKWQRWGYEHMQSIVNNAVYAVRMAIDTQFPESEQNVSDEGRS
jgi:hypothetical protein